MKKYEYRPEIDTLRALAVTAVIIYHAKIYLFENLIFSGGFIGVDIFFTISGYLITAIILKELIDKKSFSFKNFYEKRARRILPALLFIILLTIPFSWIYLYPIDLVNFSKSILSSLGFGSNFYFHFSGLEYSSSESILKPLLHTWSLSVEEQYYILFPIGLVATFKYFRRYLVHFLLICFISSLLMAEWGSKNYISATFYFIHSRIWELIIGSLIAYFEIKLGHRGQNKILCSTLPILGLFLIICSFIFFNSETYHPSFYTLVPVLGVALILWFTNKNDIISKIFSYKIFVKIGLISYSLYLWHYPIFSFANHLEIFFDNNFGKLILIIITFILSIFTYNLIEQPARKAKSSKVVFTTMIIFTLIIAIYSVVVISMDGFLNRVKVKNYQNEHSFLYLKQNNEICFGRINNFCKFGSHKKEVILIGDSHLGSLAYDLYDKVKSNFTFLPIVGPGYFHLRDIEQVNKHTNKVNKGYNVLRNDVDEILNESKDNIIIIGGVTSLYFYNKRIEDRAMHWDFMFVDKKSLKYDLKTIQNSFVNMIKELSVNNEVILLYPLPEVGVNLQKKKFGNMVRVFEYTYSDFLKQNKEVINFFDSINLPKVHKVFSYKAFCNEVSNTCITHDTNNFFFFDGYHPSIEGSKKINKLIIEKIDLIKKNKDR